jgi:tetratricopeptide (TPR) repeat protein
VYSLGVLLYELIAGVQPIPSDLLRKGGYDQVQRIIRETEPPRPSTRLGNLGEADATRIAQRRRAALPTLIRDLRSELEWIPLKAIRKDREQRYRSAAELADDIRNYLHGRPLIAGPESTGYKLRKFAQRHQAGVAVSGAMILLLTGGIIATTWQAVRATRAERHVDREAIAARKQAAIAGSFNQLMTDMIVKANRGQQGGNPNVTVRAVMDAAAAELGHHATSREPEVEAALRGAIGATYANLGLYDAAEPLLRRALELHLNTGGVETLAGASSRTDLASVLHARGNYEEAERFSREALAIRRKLQGDVHADVAMAMQTLGAMFWSKGDYVTAEPFFRDSLAMQRRLLGDEHKDVAHSLGNLAALLIMKGEYDAAEPVCREALAMRRKLHGPDSIEVAGTLSNLAMLLVRQGDYAAAEAPTREALAMRRKLLGEEHPDVATSLNNLAGLLLETGEVDGAAFHFREALLLRRKLLGDDHPEVLMTMNNLAGALTQLRDYAGAEPLLREALDRSRRVSGDGHANTLSILRNLGRSYSAQQRFAEAEPVLAELYRRAPAAQLPPQHVAQYVSFYGPCLAKLGRYAEAEHPLRDAMDRLRATDQTRGEHMRRVLSALADVCQHTARPDEAARWRVELAALSPSTRPATGPAGPS